MSQTGMNPELNLDQLLAGMAKDVPPMPADFHDKWMNAVRAESKQTSPNSSNQTNQAKPAAQPEAAPVSQWPKILSIAAVFVFLIGGTLIYRSARKPILPGSGSVNSAAVTETVETEETAISETAVSETAITGSAMRKAADAAEKAGSKMETAGGAGFSGMNSDAEAPALAMNSAEEADFAAVNSAAEAPVMAMNSAEEAAYEADAMEEAEVAYDSVMEEAKEAETRPAVNMAAEAPAAEAAPTEVPATEAPAAEITPTEIPATEAPVSAPAVREGIGGFFADMGDFLLVVWPYLLAALALLAIAAAAKKFRKKE